MQFWPNTEIDLKPAHAGFKLNLRGDIALHLIERWGEVTGSIREKEDTAGRAVLDVMPVKDVVERAFHMADLAVAELELRVWIKPVEMTLEDLGEIQGKVGAAQDRTRYDIREQERNLAGAEEKKP